MRRALISFLFIAIGLAGVLGQAESERKVYRLSLDDIIISPVVSEYIENGIAMAERDGAEALLIELDTPGGLLSSTRAIVKDIMNAEVPVIVYVAPSGSRAGSAGVFITLAAHVAAMAPSTNIGAAHPVTVGGEKPKDEGGGLREWLRSLKEKEEAEKGKKETKKKAPEKKKETPQEPMSEKILNDTVAWVKAIAEQRGRNVSWAIRAVTESVSVPEGEAIKKKVVDFIASDAKELLQKVDGKKVKLVSGERVLRTAGATIVDYALSARQKLLNILINPNIAYIFMMLGFYGLLFEITHPGSWFPGIAGAICLILALYAFHTIPTNYAGLGLILLAIALFVAEALVTSYGLLTVGGIVCMLLGSLFLIDSPFEFMQVSLTVIIPIVLATAFVAVFLVSLAIRAQRQGATTGVEGMVGMVATAESSISTTGKIFVNGEYWDACSDELIASGEKIKIISVEGMKLKVKKMS